MGSAACGIAQMPITRRSPPVDNVTASVVSVAMWPLPANNVGRYCPTLTAKATAQAINVGRSRMGNLMRQKVVALDAPRLSEVRV